MKAEPQDGGGDPRQWPESVEAAVMILRCLVPVVEQARIAAMAREDLINLDFELGAWIRCTFGLSTGNDELLDATGCRQPNDASDVVIEALWNVLRAEAGGESGLDALTSTSPPIPKAGEPC